MGNEKTPVTADMTYTFIVCCALVVGSANCAVAQGPPSFKARGPVMTIEQRSKGESEIEIVKLIELDRQGRVISEKKWMERERKPLGPAVEDTVRYSQKSVALTAVTYRDERQPVSASIYYARETAPSLQAHVAYHDDGSLLAFYIRNLDQCDNAIEELTYLTQAPFFQRADISNNYREGCLLRDREVRFLGGRHTRYIFDDRGRPVESFQYSADDVLELLETSKYNEHDDLVETVTFDAEHKVKQRTIIVYEYDAHRNWVSRSTRVIQKDGHPVTGSEAVDRRVINYFR